MCININFNMHRILYRMLLPILGMVLINPFNAAAGELIREGEVITLERCMEIALSKHPNILATRNTVSINQSKVGQAEANYYPQLNWSVGYKRYSSISGGTTGTITSREAADSFDQYSSSVTLTQNIFDFGKTPAQVNIQGLLLDSSLSELGNVSDQIVFNVKQAYYRVLQAKRNRDVAIETVQQFQKHLEQANGFYFVGTKPRFDVTKAEVDLSNARLNLIKSENALRIAIVNLNNTMGIPNVPDYTIEDNLSFKEYNISFEDAIKRANENRPDLKSIIAKKDAAGNSIELAKKGYYPVLTGNASYNWSGERFPLEDGWNAGATLSFPLFSGFLTRYQVEESRANLNVLEANEELLRQNIFLEVRQAYLNIKEAEERITATELTVKQAEENLEVANGRYAAGVGNPIEVTDAEVVLSNAKTAYIQALYDYKIAQASLEKAVGVR